jgi:hypothetical protein
MIVIGLATCKPPRNFSSPNSIAHAIMNWWNKTDDPWTWVDGYNIMRVLGNRLTLHSPSRGFSMELGSAITVLLASQCKFTIMFFLISDGLGRVMYYCALVSLSGR